MNGIAELYRLRLADGIAAGDVTPMMCFPIGEWHSSKYPDLPLTEDLANEIIANFAGNVLGTEPVVDSSGSHDTSAPAAGWVKRVYLASYEQGDVTGLALWADVKWTQLGAELLTDEQYKYGSVEVGSVTLNDSGETIDNVLRSLTLTNTPVLRLMPGVQNAAEKQRDVVTLSLSEVTAAEPGSYNDLRDTLERQLMDAFGERLWVCDFGTEWVVYEGSGLDDVQHTYRTPYEKAEEGITLGQPVEVKRETTYVPVSDSNPALTPQSADSAAVAPGKAAEGQTAAFTEGAAPKGSDHMKTVAVKLNLAEDADEGSILAGVVKLAEDRDAEKARADAAELKLTERDKAERTRAFEAKFAEATEPDEKGRVRVLPGEKDAYAKLAEADHDATLAALDARMSGPVALQLGEVGSGGEGESHADPSVELAAKAKARAKADSTTYAEAERMVLAEDESLAERYRAFRINPKEA